MATFIRNVERYVELHKNLTEAAKTTKDMRKEKTMRLATQSPFKRQAHRLVGQVRLRLY